MGYADGSYWRERSDLLYYQYMRYIIRCIGANAGSIIDVGSGNSPYLEWFDWIPEKFSVDLRTPYSSEAVESITGNILDLKFDRKYDICTCLQVLEHVRAPERFARRLFDLSDLVLISVPHQWPAGSVKRHVNDPVALKDVVRWFGRKPNYHLIVHEPFLRQHGERLFAIFNVAEPEKSYGKEVRNQRRPLPAEPAGSPASHDPAKRGFRAPGPNEKSALSPRRGLSTAAAPAPNSAPVTQDVAQDLAGRARHRRNPQPRRRVQRLVAKLWGPLQRLVSRLPCGAARRLKGFVAAGAKSAMAGRGRRL